MFEIFNLERKAEKEYLIVIVKVNQTKGFAYSTFRCPNLEKSGGKVADIFKAVKYLQKLSTPNQNTLTNNNIDIFFILVFY